VAHFNQDQQKQNQKPVQKESTGDGQTKGADLKMYNQKLKSEKEGYENY